MLHVAAQSAFGVNGHEALLHSNKINGSQNYRDQLLVLHGVDKFLRRLWCWTVGVSDVS